MQGKQPHLLFFGEEITECLATLLSLQSSFHLVNDLYIIFRLNQQNCIRIPIFIDEI